MKIYNALLLLYPKSFRQEYGDDMRGIFRARLGAAEGALAFLGVWLGAIRDVAQNAFLTHLDILGQDLNFTLRTLARTPGFTVTAATLRRL